MNWETWKFIQPKMIHNNDICNCYDNKQKTLCKEHYYSWFEIFNNITPISSFRDLENIERMIIIPNETLQQPLRDKLEHLTNDEINKIIKRSRISRV
jgi:hypothetical protein